MIYEGGLNAEYVFDSMEMYEVNFHLKNLYKKSKENWEQTRFTSYITAQCNSTKKLKITDIIKFSWDKENKKDTSISQSDIDRLTIQAQQYEKLLQENGK